MARIKLPKLKRVHFSTLIDIRVDDLNYGGHVGNDRFLSLAHEARLRYLHSLNADELNFYGTGLIMTDAALTYMAEVFRGDQLKIELAVEDLDERRFDINYSMLRCSDKKEVARVKTGMTCFDYNERKLRPLPQGFIDHILNFQES